MGERIPPTEGDQIARSLEQQTGGRWVIWYGHHTGRFWAIPRGRHWNGLIEADGALEMLIRIGEVDAWFGIDGTTPARRRAETVPVRTPVGAWGLI